MRTLQEQQTALAIIRLMNGVVYQELDEDVWQALHRHTAAVKDHFASIGVEVVIDDAEGYAYLRAHPESETERPLPRLVARRALPYHDSLLLVLLRKRLVEFETTGGETKLVVTREELISMLQIFLADTQDEARAVDRIDTIIRRVTEMGFLRPLRGEENTWEVMRILKAYVDAQTLADFEAKLAEYAAAAGRFDHA